MSLINYIPPTYNAVNAIFGGIPLEKVNCQKLGHIIYNNIEIDFVSRAISECKNQINQKFSKFKLSPLHLAVMKGRVDVANLLIENGAQINAEDHQKFTPLHHAALTGNELILSLLRSKGANEFAANRHRGTYQDIQRLTRQDFNATGSINSLGDSIISNINPTCLKHNVTLITENVIEPQELVDRWATIVSQATRPPMAERIQPALRQAYAAYKANPPNLIVDHVTQDDEGTTVSIPSRPCGVFAGQNIKPGQIIREYIGQIVSKAPNDKTYFLEGVDGGSYRNEGAMMNDAFPNAFIFPIYDVNGIEERHLIIALEHIQPGHEIVWDYQIEDDTKFIGHQELRPKAIKEFLATHSWKDMIVSYKKLFAGSTNMESLAKNHRMLQAINYIFHTPSTFLSLIEDGTIDQKVMKVLTSELKFWGQTLIGSWIIHMKNVLDIKVMIGKVSPEFSRQVIAQYRDALPLIKGGTYLVEIQATAYSALKNLATNFAKVKHKVDKNGIFDKNEADKLLKKLRDDFTKKTLFGEKTAFNYIKKEWDI